MKVIGGGLPNGAEISSSIFGKYTLEIATRCGLGSAYEVRVATRKITVK